MTKRKTGAPGDTEIEALLQQFLSGGMRINEGEQAIARLRLSKERVLPQLLNMISNPDEGSHIMAAQLLMALQDCSVVRPLLGLLDDPTVDDWCKLSIFTVLQHFEAAVDLETLYRRLHDPAAVAYRSQENLLDSFSRARELAQFANVLAQQVPPEARREMICRLAETGDPRAVFPLRAALHMPEETVVLAAIEGLNTLRAAVAIRWLEDLARHGSTEMIRREAGKVAGHLTMRSSVPGADVIRELLPLAEAQWPLHSCWLTIIDGAGGQIAFVVRERPDGYLVVGDMMFTDREGLRDCLGADMMAQEEFDELLSELAGGGITAVEVSLERCREAVESAYARALAVGRRLPLEYFAWGEMLRGEDTRVIEEWPVDEVDTMARPDLLARSIRLLGLGEMSSWLFNPEETQGFAERFRRLPQQSYTSRPNMLRVLRQGVRSLVDEERRALLGTRMRQQAWLLAQVYADEEVWQQAMAASAALGKKGVPSDQHPLLLGMMAASLDSLLATELLDEVLNWEEEAWIRIAERSSAPPTVPQPALSEWGKLCTFLQKTDLEIPTSLSNLVSAEEPRSLLGEMEPAQVVLRALNWLESVFGQEIDSHLYDSQGLDWRKLREELGLIPPIEIKSPVLQDIEADLAEQMELEGCSPTMISRARQLWDDYIFLTQGQVRPLRKPQSWAAAVEYLAHLLYFDWETQAEAASSYQVSMATVSKRYHSLCEELGVQIFSYPLQRDWQATEALEAWSQLSPVEIVQRLFGRSAELGQLFP